MIFCISLYALFLVVLFLNNRDYIEVEVFFQAVDDTAKPKTAVFFKGGKRCNWLSS